MVTMLTVSVMFPYSKTIQRIITLIQYWNIFYYTLFPTYQSIADQVYNQEKYISVQYGLNWGLTIY